MSHELTVNNSTTGESSCSCGEWGYVVIDPQRPYWPKDPAAVKGQVESNFNAHVRVSNTVARQQELSRAPGSWRCRCGAENPNVATLCRKCNRGTIDEAARVQIK